MKERYIIAIELIGVALLVASLTYSIGLLPTVTLLASVMLIVGANLVKMR